MATDHTLFLQTVFGCAWLREKHLCVNVFIHTFLRFSKNLRISAFQNRRLPLNIEYTLSIVKYIFSFVHIKKSVYLCISNEVQMNPIEY